VKPANAPVERTCVSRADESPASWITFETVPLIAKSVEARKTIP